MSPNPRQRKACFQIEMIKAAATVLARDIPYRKVARNTFALTKQQKKDYTKCFAMLSKTEFGQELAKNLKWLNPPIKESD